MTEAILLLEDGRAFEGRSFGARGTAFGEVVFNTALAGYQETLTDPSYGGQIVVMTAPHVGNYGVTPEDAESARIQVAGFVARHFPERPSSARAQGSLGEALARSGIVAADGVDTRALVRHLRSRPVPARRTGSHRSLRVPRASRPSISGSSGASSRSSRRAGSTSPSFRPTRRPRSSSHSHSTAISSRTGRAIRPRSPVRPPRPPC